MFGGSSILLSIVPPPVPPPVPLQYSQRFTMSDGSAGMLHYDYPGRQQRLDHFNNSSPVRQNQCYFWFNRTGPCTEFFTSDAEQYVYFPADDTCCLESCQEVCPASWNASDGSCCREPALYLPRPSSVSACKYNSSLVWRSMPVLWYQCPACLNYYFRQSDLQPVAFFDDDHNYAVFFDVPSQVVGPPPRQLFTLPASCSQKTKCRGFTSKPSLICDGRPPPPPPLEVPQ